MEIPNIKIDISRKYLVVLEQVENGVTTEYQIDTITYMDNNGIGVSGKGTAAWLCAFYDGKVKSYSASATNQIIIKEIYDIGPAENAKKEDGFVLFNEEDVWYLIETPEDEYEVPATVDGQAVEVVYIDLLQGTPVFTQRVELAYWKTEKTITNVKINFIDYDFIYEVTTFMTVGSKMDLTECGDNLEPTDEIISAFGATSGKTLYVTQAVKDKYPEETNIQVKSE